MTDIALMHWAVFVLCLLLFLERFGPRLTKLVTPFFTAFFNGKNGNSMKGT